MKINEIAPGQKRNLQPIKFENIWNKLIVPNCTEIIKIYKANFNSILYRGITHSNPIIRGSSRTNRNTKDSFPLISDLFDIGLKETGMTAIRSNSIFAINDYEHATLFGRPYIIFPLDGFEYTYTTYFDLTLNKLYFFIDTWSNRTLIRQIDRNCPDKLKEYDNWYKNPKFFNLHESLKLNMPKINALLTKIGLPHIKQEDLIDIERFKTKVNPQNSGWSSNKFNREVMIKGSFYAFDSNIYKRLIFDKFRS